MRDMWIHEHEDWPNFKFDSAVLVARLSRIRYQQGHLFGRLKDVGLSLQSKVTLSTLTEDIVRSSTIEGENLNMTEVRSSIARHLGIETAVTKIVNRDIEGVVEMMLDATQNFALPLTKERMWGWHAALFPRGYSGMRRILTAQWRTVSTGEMQVVSGPIGKEKVHFEAPKADKIDSEMSRFLEWLEKNQDMDGILKAGIAHFWFVTIHPFEDGNGRIARAIGDLALARADGVSQRFYSLSKQIEKDRSNYYLHLERQQRGSLDITNWLLWFLSILEQALMQSESSLDAVLKKNKVMSVYSSAIFAR